ncbi:MAG: 2-oxoglutarate dehydrogenase E1 component [Planctomycetaceae bacterium]|nr:2-oxoglutarate dehydrogenase E1 component [Planctomycetaceae bacterium]MCP4476487.1 2-oxoglutarate dehydrogenase E1 component [Planctomycetaceae bacterium]MCP4774617.1 2-oxoglutarate dehydrogenase E1 component [Planctomycetaceae bacterium]
MNVFSRAYIDSLFDDYQQDPSSLPPEWQTYFENFDPDNSEIDFSSLPVASNSSASSPDHNTTNSRSVAQLQDRVDQLIRGFRVRGHLEAKIDPLGRPRATNNELNPESYGLLPSDFPKNFSARTVDGQNFRSLEEIVDLMRQTYCRSIGVQFMHIDDHDVRNWLQTRMEGSRNRMQLHRKTQLRILTKLTDAVIFEEFMRKKFLGAKTFSLEGAETLIPLLDLALEKAGDHGVKQVVLGMAHRGRLNVLANIMGKRAQNIFWGFDDPDPEKHRGGGDVLYHLGHSNDWVTSKGKKVHISLCFNPSHLEFVNPVAMGRCRSKQDRTSDVDQSETMTVLIHGDAAFAGEGVVQETLNLSQLEGYKVGGTLHVIVNNQVGFTTDCHDSRSTTYASDVAKMLQIPIFHVNGEDPEAVAQVVNLAMEFRRAFNRDVVIDMYCYRRLGHNESDEPRFTQPLMYKSIDSRPTIRDSYLKRLLKMQEVTQEEADLIAEQRGTKLQDEFESTKIAGFTPDTQTLEGLWSGYYGGKERSDDEADTTVSKEVLTEVIRNTATVPETFNLHRKLKRVLETRVDSANGNRAIDWATAELAALGTLAIEGHPVRLSGQDCGRGTFSQRHAVLHDTQSAESYTPLNHLGESQAKVNVINSPLSEAGVLGFDYGYSLDAPDSLIIWEAQFGDFFNAAQVIVDQFICSAEDKWNRLSGLTMFLPHGFEGAGPEHCSGRLERFLTSAAEHNFQVAIPTTAAQHFHLLRRQVKRKWRKPLVVFTPKSLLREPYVASPIEQFTEGQFQRVIADEAVRNDSAPQRVLLTAGKIGVELLKAREQAERTDFAVIRVEQLYPLPHKEIEACLSQYASGTPVFWVQEEPRNMGGWYFMKVKWDEFGLEEKWPLKVICRPESASPSTGSKKSHKIEQEDIMNTAMSFQRTANV